MPINVQLNMEPTVILVFAVSPSRNLAIFLLVLALLCLRCDEPESQITIISEDDPVHVAPLTAVQPVLNEKATHRIQQFFDSLYSVGRFNGVALFASNDSVFILKLGVRNYETGEQVEVDDQFQLASLSKPFTALAVLMLAEQGLIDLNAQISTYLPELPYSGVTVHHLLSHTSGIAYYAYSTDNLWPSQNDYMVNTDLYTMLECEEIPTWQPPGKGFNYCNTNYTILADLVQKVSGMPFRQFMSQNIFEPVGMDDTEILDVHCKSPQQYEVQGHFPSNDLKSMCYLDGVVGDKGMYSTVSDLYKFYKSYNKGELIGDSLYQMARSAQADAGTNSYYGLGWRLKVLEAEKDTMIYHNGWWRGFRSYYWTSKNEDKCAIILTNHIGGGYLKSEEVWHLF